MTLLRLIPAMATHRGMRRQINEDAVAYEYPSDTALLQSHGALFIVADGVGGLSAGDEASQLTVKQLLKHYYAENPRNIEQSLVQAIRAVNRDVYTTLNRKGATTLVAVVIINDHLIVASAGDSQVFHIKDDTALQLNEEDVLHTDDADDGALTKAIGYREDIDIETSSTVLYSGDKVLLCSDGLTLYLKDNHLVQLSNLRDPRDGVRRMINQANHAGGADNVTALLIHIGEAIEAGDVAAHIRRISVRVAVDTDPMIMQDVPSKPTTQIPLSRPETVIDESLLGIPELPQRQEESVKKVDVPAQAQETVPESRSSSNNGMIVIIVVAVVILAIGAVIFGIALASLGG